VELAGAMGAERVSVLRFVPQGRGAIMPSLALTRAENLELRRQIIRARKGFSVRTGSPYNFLWLNPHPSCCAAIDRAIVAPDFRLYPCDAFKQVSAVGLAADEVSPLVFGSLAKCWANSPLLNAVRDYLTSDFEPPCASCGRLGACLSGCLAQKVISAGDFRKLPDPMCLLSEVAR